jgi:hypothetical protein
LKYNQPTINVISECIWKKKVRTGHRKPVVKNAYLLKIYTSIAGASE